MASSKAMPPRTALQLIISLALVLAASPLAAQDAVDRLIPAAPTGYLTDVAGIVDAASATRIEQVAKALRERTGAELAVVTLPDIGDNDASAVARGIGRRWGVGAKADVGSPIRNAGMVILLVPRQQGRDGSGHLRLEVGQGLEGIIPDATARRIHDAMIPQLAREQYGPGLVTGVEAVASRVAAQLGVRDSVLATTRPAGSGGGGLSPLLMLLLFFVIFGIFTAMMNRGNQAHRGRRRPGVYWGPGPWIGGGGWGGGGFGGGGGGGFGGFGGGGGFSGGGFGGRF